MLSPIAVFRSRRSVARAGIVGALSLAMVALGACSDSEDNRSCGPVRRERVDPASSLHLLPNAAEPAYASDPPTSGPHRSGPAPRGVVSEPLERPVQVAVLEQGGVIIQYRDPRNGKALAALADGASVVIAPNPDLPAEVVATAWAVKQVCTRVDEGVLRTFIEDRPVVGRSHE
ncbi:MAG: DUF3105 domain-containing protein [Acidimicrobiales bacterium]